jgi:hypothetical protein
LVDGERADNVGALGANFAGVMLYRFLSGALAVAALALLGNACDDSGGGGGSSAGGAGGTGPACAQYATCQACTPANGCGWCSYPEGTGECVSSPDRCREHAFSWTWDPSGCFVPADASVNPTTPAPPSSTDAANDAATVGD